MCFECFCENSMSYHDYFVTKVQIIDEIFANSTNILMYFNNMSALALSRRSAIASQQSAPMLDRLASGREAHGSSLSTCRP